MKPRLVLFAALAAVGLCAVAAQSLNPIGERWILAGQAPKHYEIGIDNSVGAIDTGVKVIRNKDGVTTSWATLMQDFSAQNYVGQRLRLSARAKAKDAKAGGLWMRVDDHAGTVLAFYNSQDQPIPGTSDWNDYSVTLDVAPNAARIYFGVIHYGGGQVWLDALKLDAVGKEVPVNRMPTYVPADRPSL